MFSNISDYQYLNGLNTKSITLVFCIRNVGTIVFMATLRHFYKCSQKYLFKETFLPFNNVSSHSLKSILIRHVFSIVIANNRDNTFEMFSSISTKADTSALDSQNHAAQNDNSWKYFLSFIYYFLPFFSSPFLMLHFTLPSVHTPAELATMEPKLTLEPGRSFVPAPGRNISKEMCFSLRNLLEFFNLSWIQKRVLSFAGLLSSSHNNSSAEYSSSFHYHGIPEIPKAGKKMEHNGFEAKWLYILLLQHCSHLRS